MIQEPSRVGNGVAIQIPGTCIRCGGIDSWTKLYLVLWLAEHRGQRLGHRDLAQALYLGDEGLITAMLWELKGAGIVVEDDGVCLLSMHPEIQACLRYLQERYTDPVQRLDLIARIRAAGAAVEDHPDGLEHP